MNEPAQKKKTILVIDDRKDDRKLVRLMLRKFDLEIVEATNGIEGLDLAEKHNPKLILIDQMMPGKTGLETVHEFRQHLDMKVNMRLKNIPVIMLSSRKFDAGFQEYLNMEGIGFHPKPVQSKTLLQQIESVIGPLPQKPAPKASGWGTAPKSSWGVKR